MSCWRFPIFSSSRLRRVRLANASAAITSKSRSINASISTVSNRHAVRIDDGDYQRGSGRTPSIDYPPLNTPSSVPPTPAILPSRQNYENFYRCRTTTTLRPTHNFACCRSAAVSVPSYLRCLSRALMWQPPPKPTMNAEHSATIVARQSQVRDFMTKVAYR